MLCQRGGIINHPEPTRCNPNVDAHAKQRTLPSIVLLCCVVWVGRCGERDVFWVAWLVDQFNIDYLDDGNRLGWHNLISCECHTLPRLPLARSSHAVFLLGLLVGRHVLSCDAWLDTFTFDRLHQPLSTCTCTSLFLLGFSLSPFRCQPSKKQVILRGVVLCLCFRVDSCVDSLNTRALQPPLFRSDVEEGWLLRHR